MFNPHYTLEVFDQDGTPVDTFVETEEIARVAGISEDALAEIVRDLDIPRQAMHYNGATGDEARVSISETWAEMIIESLQG